MASSVVPQSPAFQSLAQMKVPQHHCVPVSLWPEGPMGLLVCQRCWSVDLGGERRG
jgi:hypothetical protein